MHRRMLMFALTLHPVIACEEEGTIPWPTPETQLGHDIAWALLYGEEAPE